MKKYYTTTYKYFIYLFRNNKLRKLVHRSANKETILNKWYELKTQIPPLYIKEKSGKRNHKIKNELLLVFPKKGKIKPIYSKDELGRNFEIKLENDDYYIKEKIPYWEEEYIYDYEKNKKIRFHEMLSYLESVTEISQLFKLNNKIILQIDDNIKMYGNKNIKDANRLYNLIVTELLKKKKMNILFSKDVSTSQRKYLYNILEEKGYSRAFLFRHYSY